MRVKSSPSFSPRAASTEVGLRIAKAMAQENDILTEADEIAAMLPWYVSGKISNADRERIEAYAAAHPELQAQIALAREEADIVFGDNAAIQAPRDALSKLRASVAAAPRSSFGVGKASILDRIGGWLQALEPRQLAYAGVASALLLLVQAASIGSILTHQGTGGYQTASGPEVSGEAATYALVAFAPGAPVGSLSAFLAESGYSIAEGPRAGGLYRLRLSTTKLSADDVGKAIGKIKARGDLFSFASAAAQKP